MSYLSEALYWLCIAMVALSFVCLYILCKMICRSARRVENAEPNPAAQLQRNGNPPIDPNRLSPYWMPREERPPQPAQRQQQQQQRPRRTSRRQKQRQERQGRHQ